MKKIKFKLTCPDCKKKKYLIRHHFITRSMVNYLIDIAGYERGSIVSLRNQLSVRICKECENKFHEDDKYERK